MKSQQPLQRQDNGTMPAHPYAARQQRQQQPEVPPTSVPQAYPALAVPPAPYRPYVAAMGPNATVQGPYHGLNQSRTTHPGYSASSPSEPPLGRQLIPTEDSPAPMAHRELYLPRYSSNFQNNPTLANVVFDRQIHNREFARERALPEGVFAEDLTQEVGRLPTEGINFRREVGGEAGTHIDLERCIGETRLAINDRQDRAMRLGLNNERRYRRSRSPPSHSGHRYLRLSPLYSSPPAGHEHRRHRSDNHGPLGHMISSRGRQSSRQSASPTYAPSSYLPPLATSELASGRPSTHASSSAAVVPPADQRSASVAAPSPVVHGPEVAFDSADEWDDDESDDFEAYDAKKGKHRAFKLRNRAAYRRSRKMPAAKYTRRGLDRRSPSRPTSPVHRWQLTRAPATSPNPALDPPQVPGAKREADMDIWPLSTDVGLTDQWYNYVPLNNAQYRDLLRSARAYDSGAAQRVRDLLHQFDTNHELSALGYLCKLKQAWNDPHRTCDLQHQRATLPSSRH